MVLAVAACAQPEPLALTADAPEVSRDVRPFRQAVEQRRYAVAVAGLRPVVQAHPDHVEAKLLLANAYLGQADVAQAARLFAEAERQTTSPFHRSEARTGRGLIALYEGDAKQAERLFREAVADDTSSALAWNGLGQSLDRQGQHRDAMRAFETALQRRPEWPAALNNLGLAQLHAGQHATAEQTLQRALSIEPTSTVIANNLRLAIAMQGRYEEALAGVLPDEEADALNNVGYAAMMRGDLGAAGRYLQRAQAVSPSFHPEADRNLRLLEQLRAQRGAGA